MDANVSVCTPKVIKMFADIFEKFNGKGNIHKLCHFKMLTVYSRCYD